MKQNTPYRHFFTFIITVIAALALLPTALWAAGNAWEPFLAFEPSASGRTDALAVFHQGTLYVLGGQPYRCPDANPCDDPELGAADYLTPGDSQWSQGKAFDNKLQNLGGGSVVGFSGPVAFGGRQGNDPIASDQTFFYDILLADQTEPNLARRNFTHSNFAWAKDNLDRLYAIGGGPGLAATSTDRNHTDVERYDPSNDTWTIIASLPWARANAAAAYDGQGHILVFGGYNELASRRSGHVLSYDIESDSWSILDTLPAPAQGTSEFSDQRALLGANGIIYIVGGINGPVADGTTRSQVYTYEPVTRTWGNAPDLAEPRHGVALALDDDGWLYALGGRNGSSGLSTSERFDTSPVGSECLIADDCADELACNGDEFCVDGACLAGNPIECGLGEICISGGMCRVQRFEIIDLSALLGGLSGTANAIDNSGRVVGEFFSSSDSEWHSFLYDGSIADIGLGRARAITENDWIAGEHGTAFVIDPTGVRHDLGTLGGAGSAALGVTTDGRTVGQSDAATGADHAFLINGPGAVMQDLGTLGDYSIAHDISPDGLIVGESLVTFYDPHAEPFIFDSSTPGAVMEVMPGAYSAGSARAVNDLGHITGWISNNVDNWGDAFVFDGTEPTKLGDIPGKAYSIGTAINNLDQVVGYAFGEWVYYECCGWIWSNSIKAAYFHDGINPTNLNDELPESSGWTLSLATGINDDGAIVGTGNFEGIGRAFLMVPLDGDQDADGISDELDNCTLVANPTQCDGDHDGYGNHCDGDFNGDLITNYFDLQILRDAIGTTDPVTDLNCDGTTNGLDFRIFRPLLGAPPGPSGIVP